ncbi:uncharacterized protein [Chanodichthys erythropterus]|uniref:uncharacterized protein isoform X2 n=1 Tax=Chanodichthys erythropterus TaxID=933992 RepID=UPI00351DF14A
MTGNSEADCRWTKKLDLSPSETPDSDTLDNINSASLEKRLRQRYLMSLSLTIFRTQTEEIEISVTVPPLTVHATTIYKVQKGVVGETDEVKSESVMEGKSVTLQNNVEVQRDDLIVWRFGDKGILLAKIDVETKEISLNDADERFRDRLQLNQNGSLTIKNTKTENAGLYGLQIRGRESTQRFLLSVSDPGLSSGVVAGIVFAALLVAAVLGAVVVYYRRKISELKKQMVEETKQSAMEGESITLPTDLTELQKDDKIKWWYQDENNLIAEIKENNEPAKFDGTDGRFRGKLRLFENGNLKITDIRTIHSGVYKLEIHNNRRTKYKKFTISVRVKTESVKEGGSVRLETSASIQTGDLLLWMFGAEKSLVATNATWPDTTDERFAGRVELNKKKGWLTIRNVRRTDRGHYKLQIINSKQTTCRRFNVDVTDSTGSQGNESVTVVMPLLKDEVVEGED